MTHIIDNISDELFRRKNALVGETLRLQCKCNGNDKKRIVTICQFRRYFDRTAITPTTTKSTTGNNLLRVSSIWGNQLIHGFILQQSNVDRDVLFIRQMLTQVGFDVSSFAFPFVSKRVKCVIDLNLVIYEWLCKRITWLRIQLFPQDCEQREVQTFLSWMSLSWHLVSLDVEILTKTKSPELKFFSDAF